jgi:hypothetical protein
LSAVAAAAAACTSNHCYPEGAVGCTTCNACTLIDKSPTHSPAAQHLVECAAAGTAEKG